MLEVGVVMFATLSIIILAIVRTMPIITRPATNVQLTVLVLLSVFAVYLRGSMLNHITFAVALSIRSMLVCVVLLHPV